MFTFSWTDNHGQMQQVQQEQISPEDHDTALCACLIQTRHIPVHAHKDLGVSLRSYLHDLRTDTRLGDQAVLQYATLPEQDQCATDQHWLIDQDAEPSPPPESVGGRLVEHYTQLLACPFADVLDTLLHKEHTLANDVQQLLRSRDWELQRLKKEHEQIVQSVSEQLASEHEQDHQQLTHVANTHFERLHMVEMNYASQLSALNESQRREYSSFVSSLCEQQQLRGTSLNAVTNTNTLNIDLNHTNISSGPHSPLPNTHTLTMDESFTIYLGSQLKSLHNLRVSAVDVLWLCGRRANVQAAHRLHMSLSLYSQQLTALVLCGPHTPAQHITLHSEFAQICERSTELHFDSLQKQTNAIEALRDHFDVGDVYVTRHSNLAHAHIVFHLIDEPKLSSEDINSRHACVNGLRNVIRLCAKFKVSTISLPLLLVNEMTEDMTVAWCMRRAEMVYKCVKGFLMEVAALGTSSAHEQLTLSQYTVQFVLPQHISEATFNQLAEMLPSIFHLVKPVFA